MLASFSRLAVLGGFLSSGLHSCSELTPQTSESLRVRMFGIQTAPEDATGTGSPFSHSYTVSAAKFVLNDGTEIDMMEGTEKVVSIVHRPQEILSNKEVKDYRDKEFSKFEITFATEVEVLGENATQATFDLPKTTYSLDEAFTFKKNSNKAATIQVSWGKTITYSEDGLEITTIDLPTINLKYTE